MTQSNLTTPDKQHGARSVSEEKLMVAVRVRPLRADEGPRIVHVVSDKALVLEDEADYRRDVLRQRRLNDKQYVYDKVFGEESTQEEVYEAVCAPLVGDTLRGFAGAIFAYGATGAGKTHTMTGLMSRALNRLFTTIAESENPKAYEDVCEKLNHHQHPLLDVSLSECTSSSTIRSCSHPAPASYLTKMSLYPVSECSTPCLPIRGIH